MELTNNQSGPFNDSLSSSNPDSLKNFLASLCMTPCSFFFVQKVFSPKGVPRIFDAFLTQFWRITDAFWNVPLFPINFDAFLTHSCALPTPFLKTPFGRYRFLGHATTWAAAESSYQKSCSFFRCVSLFLVFQDSWGVQTRLGGLMVCFGQPASVT